MRIRRLKVAFLMIHPSVSRLLLLLAIVCSVPLTGCDRFFRQPMNVPDGIESLPGIMALQEEDLTPERFSEAFPPIDTFIMSSRVLARYRRILGKTYFEMSMVAAGPKMLRMAGRHPGDRTTVFDLVVSFPRMHVYLPFEGAYYRGDIPPEGSPFGTSFGVEPWDLIPIIEIGQRLGYAQFSVENDLKGRTLLLSEQDLKADGLERVVLHDPTGIPEEAYWKRGAVEHQVIYQAWGIVESIGNPGEMHLMPTEFSIQRNDPYARIEVRPREELQQFKIEPELSRRTFELIFPAGTAMRPLEELGDLLGGS